MSLIIAQVFKEYKIVIKYQELRMTETSKKKTGK